MEVLLHSKPLQLRVRFAAVSQSLRHCHSFVFPLQHLETWNSVDRLDICVWLQRPCEKSESIDNTKGERLKVEVGRNGKVIEKKKTAVEVKSRGVMENRMRGSESR